MEQYIKGFKGFTPVKMCGLSPLASFYFKDRQFIFNNLTFTIFVAFYFLLFSLNSHALCRGGSRGRVQRVRPPPDDLQFSNTTGILQKKTMWFIGVEVEQETLRIPFKTHHFTYLSGNSVCDFSPSRASPD